METPFKSNKITKIDVVLRGSNTSQKIEASDISHAEEDTEGVVIYLKNGSTIHTSTTKEHYDRMIAKATGDGAPYIQK